MEMHRYVMLFRLHFPNFRFSFQPISTSPKDIWPSSRVRRTFIDYFSSQGCAVVPSSSVIPLDDRSILFVNAGMNQFKPVFLGTLNPKDVRGNLRLAANSQKCIRAGGKHNDLAEVGRDGTHHTFFEMLGNWGFNGHLSKKAACKQALELLTAVYGLEKRRLFVTYFNGNEKLGLSADMECREVWRELGFTDDRILAMGMEDNFWEMSSSGGPCGPCTEILYNGSDSPTASDSMEIWNIVFISYNKLADGKLIPLPAMHVDTGMGLERLCCVLQGVKTTYETDLFLPLLEEIRIRTGAPKYAGLFGAEDTNGIDTAYRILADHARMFTVALADGVAPASNRAGNILRRVIRNSAYQASNMWSNIPRRGRTKLQLHHLASVVANTLGEAYPEIPANLGYICQIMEQEQNVFEDLVQKAKQRLGLLLAKTKGSLSASDLFQFHQEYGLPQDILVAMVRKKDVQFDEQEFQKRMDDYKNSTRVFPTTGAFEADLTNLVNQLKEKQISVTDDSPKYDAFSAGSGQYFIPPRMAQVVAMAKSDQLLSSVPMGIECTIILDTTPFYAEAGGQSGDRGEIKSGDNKFVVEATYARGGYVFHKGRLDGGNMNIGDLVFAEVDQKRRLGCMQHHTATHLVMATLDRLLGCVRQRSSKLNSEVSKLGFWCSAQMTPEIVLKLERDVNELIARNLPVFTEEVPFEKAKSCPKIRWIQGEYYPEIVRVVSVGLPVKHLFDQTSKNADSLASAELCCGTHVSSLGHIGKLRIISVEEGSSAAVKTISFAVGRSAMSAELKGREFAEATALELEQMRRDGPADERVLLQLKEKAIQAVIPFETRGKVLIEIQRFIAQRPVRGSAKGNVKLM